VRFELEKQIATVDYEENHTRALIPSSQAFWSVVLGNAGSGKTYLGTGSAIPLFPAIVIHSQIQSAQSAADIKEDHPLTAGPGVECSGIINSYSQGEKTSGRLSDHFVELLLHAVETTEEETHAMTRSRLDSILPMREVCTISTWLSTKARMATINSTALLFPVSFSLLLLINIW